MAIISSLIADPTSRTCCSTNRSSEASKTPSPLRSKPAAQNRQQVCESSLWSQDGIRMTPGRASKCFHLLVGCLLVCLFAYLLVCLLVCLFVSARVFLKQLVQGWKCKKRLSDHYQSSLSTVVTTTWDVNSKNGANYST